MAAQLIRAEEALFILKFFPFLIILSESQVSWIIFTGIKERFVSETVDSDFEVKFVRSMNFYPFVYTSDLDQSLEAFVALCNLYLNPRYYNLGQKVLRILLFPTHRRPTLRIWHHGDPSPHPSLVNVV